MSYLFLIIPPIIIIVSLAILLHLVYKRSGDVFRLRNSASGDAEIKEKRKFDFSKLYPTLLKFLEKLLSGFKSYFAKFIKVLENWHNKVKQRQGNKGDDDFGEGEAEEDFSKRKLRTANSGFNLNKFKRKRKRRASFSQGEEFEEEEVEDKSRQKKENREAMNGLDRQEKKDFLQDSRDKNLEAEPEKDEKRKNQPMLKKEVVYPERQENKVEDAIEERLISRIAASPKDIKAYEELGDYYIEHNNFKDALGCYKQIIKLNPANRRAKIGIRRLEKMINKR